MLSSAHHIKLWQTDMMAAYTPGMFESLLSMRELTIIWPEPCQLLTSYRDPLKYEERAVAWLVKAIPGDGQPLRHLRSIRISASSIKIIVPAQLPNRQELLIEAEGILKLQFEEPLATASSLTRFHVSAQALAIAAEDVLRMSCSLLRRGLTLAAVLKSQARHEHMPKVKRSCVFLQSFDTGQPSLRERDHDLYPHTLECRCGACFKCLRKAGLLDAWSRGC